MVLDPDQAFVRRATEQDCDGCGLPIMPGENWGCAHAFVPVMGFIPMTVELHQHVHIGCAEGDVKWLALSSLGRSTAGSN